MALDNKKVAEELISYTIVTDKNSIVNLLKRNGVKLSDNPSNSEVTVAVLVANSKSPSFKNELAKLLSSKVDEAGEKFSNIVGNDQDFGFTGVDDVTYMPNVLGFTGSDDYQNLITDVKPNISSNYATSAFEKAQALTPTTKDKQQTKAGSVLSSLWGFTRDNILTKENVSAGINAGLNKINTDTLAKQQNLQLQQMQLDAQQLQMNRQLGKGAGASGNTILYVVIGLIAIAGIGFVVYKQTKK